MTPDLLNLPALKVLSYEDQGDHYRIVAEGDREPQTCVECGSWDFYRHGAQTQNYMDAPMHGKKVIIEISRRRFRCKQCGKTTFEPLPDIDSKRLATTRLIEYIEKRCLSDTFMALAREVGVDNKTIRNIFDDYVARKEAEVKFEVPEILGLDEIKIIGDYRATLTNIEKLSIFDLLQTRKQVSMMEYFRGLPDKEKVRVLVMDMWRPYKRIGKELFPGRPIVVDKFHVVRMANYALEMVRKRVRKTLEAKDRIKLKDNRFSLLRRFDETSDNERKTMREWFAKYPELEKAYIAKEQFYGIYEQSSRERAELSAKKWLDELDPDIARHFREVTTALTNWWEQIFNYYDHPVTNAYTESVNNLTRNIQRMGRGYSFEVIRARLLYDERAMRNATLSLRRRVATSRPSQPDGAFGMYTGREHSSVRIIEETKSYGAHLPTLVKLLEEGHFS